MIRATSRPVPDGSMPRVIPRPGPPGNRLVPPCRGPGVSSHGMCGRFTLTRPDLDALARELAAEVDAETARLHSPRWNVAPTTRSIIVVQDGARRLVSARFGTDVPGGRFVINARIETAARLGAFRDAFAHAR